MNNEPALVDGDIYRVELPDFEGPLDLLLHLVKKHELSILDIPIAFITEKYLQSLDDMRAANLEIAGDYLLMAATLAYLKSRELVPPDPSELVDEGNPEDEEVGDPRQELIRRLLEYQKYKQAADQLGQRPVMGRNVWTRGATAEEVAGLHVLPGGAPLAEVPVIRLIECLERVLSRAKVTSTHDVIVEKFNITDKIIELSGRLADLGTFTFESCFEFVEQEASAATMKHQIIITFLAILEMTRLKLARLTQADPEQQGAIYVSRAVDDIRERAAALGKQDEEYR